MEIKKRWLNIVFDHLLFFISRDEATRTPDPYVPNVVRYQLRYIPIDSDCSKSAAKVVLFCELSKFLWEKLCFLDFLLYLCSRN